MSRPKAIPTYRLHRPSGKAVVTLTDSAGRRKDVYLGVYGTAESKAEYARVLQLWQTGEQKVQSIARPGEALTVAEVLARFWEYAKQYYRSPDGARTNELDEFKYSLRPANFLFGSTIATEFGPKALQAVRSVMIKGYDHPAYGLQNALARGVINRRVGRIKLAFKWAVKEELVPGTVDHALQTVEGLRRGRSDARETEPVKPVPKSFVVGTMAKAPPIIADMIELQLLTGVRPGELVIMRGIDVDTSGPIWQYTPAKHKTQHHGHSRVIAIGPKAQAIIRRYLKADVQAPLFSPNEAREQLFRNLRAKRTTKVQPSQVCRKKAKPKKLPGNEYTTKSYARAIARAAKAADIPHWHPHQLLHTRATEIRKQFGIDAARAVLGHRSPAITEVYAELDQGQAAEVMAKIG